MRQLRVATAQFEPGDGDKPYNLARIDHLTRQAAAQGAELVVFHECSISGYTFLENLAVSQLQELAEPIPGPSTAALREIAANHNVAIGAGLLELDGETLYNAFAVVTADAVLANHRKIHAFIHDSVACGDRFTVFELGGTKIGILTCYDNNLPENTRATAMLGADVILMPHVTGCLPSPMPGRGIVDPEIWRNRDLDPVRCRQEFDGPKGRAWLHRWLPARAFENGVFAVYANPIGEEGGTVKPGGSMILDPYGEILAECRKLGDEVVVATLDPTKREQASGPGYIRARRPELYGILTEPNPDLGPGGRPDVWWKKNRQTES